MSRISKKLKIFLTSIICNMDIFNTILEQCSSTGEKDYTYVGIGSAPHDPPDKISAEWDQVLPEFIIDILKNTTKTIRCIHIDPAFKLDSMKLYFESKRPRLTMSLHEKYWMWSNSRFEIIVVPEYMEHDTTSYESFFQTLTDQVLETGGQLVVQEFTGHELNKLRKSIYSHIEPDQKSLFKKKILFDLTYGEACHCMTDMTKYKPFYDLRGDFFNFTLYTPDEMKSYIGMSEQTDSIIFNYFYGQYKEILDAIHLTYRRNIKRAENATDENPDELMTLLQEKLRSLFPVFRGLRVLTPEKEAALNTLFKDYREIDIYKWYTAVKNHLQPSAH